jgi:hypothetical protein
VARIVDIVVGTDGFRDFVTLPEGDTYNLGSTSVLKLVTDLVPSTSVARRALKSFVEGNSAKLSVDLDALRVLLAPKRARWATPRANDTSSMGEVSRNPSTRGHMDSKSFAEKFAAVQKTVQYIEGALQAGDVKAVKGAYEALAQRVAAVKTAVEAGEQQDEKKDEKKDEGQKQAGEIPPQFKENAEKKKEEAEAKKEEKSDKEASVKTASYESLEENSKLAKEILASLDETHVLVEAAVEAKQPVNGSKANGDLFKIASRLSGLLKDADMAQPWVKDDLVAMASRVSTIKSFFTPKK